MSAELHNLKIQRHPQSDFEYIEFPLFENLLAKVKLKKVIIKTTDEEIAQGILNRDMAFSDVVVETIN